MKQYIDRLNNYLITHHPVVWNLKIVPITILVATLILAMAFISFIATDTSIKGYYDAPFRGLYVVLIFVLVLVSIVLLIFWLIQYNKNSSLKIFYPQSNLSLYGEWFGTFVICLMLILLPTTIGFGKSLRWTTSMSETEFDRFTKILTMADVLLPAGTSNYEFDSYNSTPMMVGDADVDRTKLDTKNFNYELDNEDPNNPIEYIGPSLLYYRDYYNDQDEIATVKSWLQSGNTEKIKELMNDYIKLHQKYGLQTDLTADNWLETIYTPPLFPISDKNIIRPFDVEDEYESWYYKGSYNEGYNPNAHFSELNRLNRYQRELNSNREDTFLSPLLYLVLCSIAIGMSILLFSFRISSGRHFILSLLAVGILFFVFGLFSGILALISSSFSKYPLLIFWIVVVVTINIYVLKKIFSGGAKRRSHIFMNIAVWSVVAFIPLIHILVSFIHEDTYNAGLSYEYRYDFFGETIFATWIINNIFIILMMYPISILMKKWIALYEE